MATNDAQVSTGSEVLAAAAEEEVEKDASRLVMMSSSSGKFGVVAVRVVTVSASSNVVSAVVVSAPWMMRVDAAVDGRNTDAETEAGVVRGSATADATA